MKALEDRILKDGVIINDDIIKVDSFLNHQVDTKLAKEIGAFFKEEFKNAKVDKVLTIATSGIPFAMAVAEAFGDVPFVFAKKTKSAITDDNNSFSSDVMSFTRGIVSTITVDKRFIKKGENILLVDDFLASGNAGIGLIDICKQANANVIGLCAVIEKGFQDGRKRLENEGIKVSSAAIIKAFKNNKPIF